MSGFEQFIIYDPVTGKERGRGFGPAGCGELQAAAYDTNLVSLGLPVGPIDVKAIKQVLKGKADALPDADREAKHKEIDKLRSLTSILKVKV